MIEWIAYSEPDAPRGGSRSATISRVHRGCYTSLVESHPRSVIPGNVVRSDTAVMLVKPKGADSGSTAIASSLSFSYKITDEIAPLVRLGFVTLSPAKPSTVEESGSAFLNPVIGALYAPKLEGPISTRAISDSIAFSRRGASLSPTRAFWTSRSTAPIRSTRTTSFRSTCRSRSEPRVHRAHRREILYMTRRQIAGPTRNGCA